MADEIKKYTNRLRDKSTNEVYFVYDEEALHADSSISLLTNDAGYIKGTELDALLRTNPNVLKPAALVDALSGYVKEEDLEGYLTEEDLASITIAGKVIEEIPATETKDINSMDLAVVDNTTSYHIPNAVGNPEGTGTKGVLNVENLDEELIKEDWITKEGRAERFVLHQQVEVSKWGSRGFILPLNNYAVSRQTEDTIYLAAGGNYLIFGEFKKKFVICRVTEDSFEELTAADESLSTVLLFDGSNVGAFLNPSSETAIEYPSRYGSLAIIVSGENSIVIDSNNISGELSEVNEHGLRSTAAIYSKSNVFIGGKGSLSITSNVKNHGIKADNISIKDYVQLYIDLQNGHDGIHVDEEHRLLISDGEFTFLNCHDAIDMGGGTDGTLEILGGKFVFQDNEKDIDCSLCEKPGRIFNMTDSTFIESEKLYNTTLITPENIRSIYAEASVTTNDGTPIYPDGNGVYRINESEIYVSGYFNNKQLYLVGSDNENKSIDVYLSNAYITNNAVKNLSGKGQTIIYTPDSGKLAIRCEAGTTNFIYQTQQTKDGDGYGAIKSKNNVTIQGAGSIYVSSVLSDAVDGSNIIVKGNGFRYFETKATNNTEEPKAALCGKSIVIGEEDDIEKLGENSYQTIYATNIIAQRNKNGDKGIFTLLLKQLGCVVTETEVVAEAGEDINPIKIGSGENAEVKFEQLRLKRDFKLPITVGSNRFVNGTIAHRWEAVGDWNVFISTSQVAAKIAELSEQFNATINTLLARIDNLEHKHLLYFPYTAATDHTDGYIEHWYCPSCGKYYFDEEGTQEATREQIILPKLIPDDDYENAPADVVDENNNVLNVEALDENGNPISVDVVENN